MEEEEVKPSKQELKYDRSTKKSLGADTFSTKQEPETATDRKFKPRFGIKKAPKGTTKGKGTTSHRRFQVGEVPLSHRTRTLSDLKPEYLSDDSENLNRARILYEVDSIVKSDMKSEKKAERMTIDQLDDFLE